MEINDGVLLGEFPGDEKGERDERGDGQCDDGPGGEPVEFVALVEEDLQGPDADGQQDQADVIDRELAPFGFACLQQLPAEHGDDDAERQVDQEYPAPGEGLRQPAADQRPDDGGEDRRHDPQPEGHAPLLRGIDRYHQGLRERQHRRAEDALQYAGADQQGKIGREPAKQRGQRE